MKVNIPKSNIDPTYRYKRDLIEIQIQNTNGGITKLTNIETICGQLGCTVDSLLKYLKKKTNTSTIEKNGIFLKKTETSDNLEKFIEEYIKTEILCPKCNNPEFNLEINKKTTIKACKACGNTR
jgi:translation initiation factor 2 beta subunit (eIF-2beta)/eIF-5